MKESDLVVKQDEKYQIAVFWKGVLVPFVKRVTFKIAIPPTVEVAARWERGDDPDAPIPTWRLMRAAGVSFVGWPAKGDPEMPAKEKKYASAQDDPKWRTPEAEWKCAGCGQVFPYSKIADRDLICPDPKCDGDCWPNDPEEWKAAEEAAAEQALINKRNQEAMRDSGYDDD